MLSKYSVKKSGFDAPVGGNTKSPLHLTESLIRKANHYLKYVPTRYTFKKKKKLVRLKQ